MIRREFLMASSVVACAAAASGVGGGPARPRSLSIFEHVSLDGYFTDAGSDMSWAHSQDPEWRSFSAGNASGDAELVFGRRTYEMMAAFWPTPQAAQAMPEVARGMNRMRKTVFSHSLENAGWQNTRIIKGDLAAEVKRMKLEPGPDLLILGSGDIVAQLAQAGLIDAFQLVTVPILLGSGRTLFAGVTGKPRLRLTKSRAFGNGYVVSWYEKSA